MSTESTRPGQGSVIQKYSVQDFGAAKPATAFGAVATPRGRKPSRDGLWREDEPFSSETGLRITLRREEGITKTRVLQVPFRFQAPVTGEFQRAMRHDWATSDTIGDGQRSRSKGRQLMDLPITTMFMDVPAADASDGIVIWNGVADPQGMIQELQWIAEMDREDNREPSVFRLVIAQPAVWGARSIVNMLASITSLTASQPSGETGVEHVSLSFLEYNEGSVARKQRPQKHAAKQVRVLDGESLYEFATRSHFHKPSAWSRIAKANGIKGVSAGDDVGLKAWMKRHQKKTLKVPASG